MSEFEFKMLGLAYYLDKGQLLTAAGRVNALHRQLRTWRPSPKRPGSPCGCATPCGSSTRSRRPRRSAPTWTTWRTSVPSRRSSPESSFHMARDHVAYCRPDNVPERNGLYAFSPEWKRALLGWLHENQDPETGFWGPRSRWTGKLLKVDTMPAADAQDELHAWALAKDKGTKMLLRYLWKDASAEQKRRTRELIEEYLRVKFEKYYVDRDGAFGHYPGAAAASLDGTGGTIGLLRDIGAFSRRRQEALWGSADSFRSEVLPVRRKRRRGREAPERPVRPVTDPRQPASDA